MRRKSMPDLVDTTEMYLRTVYELMEEGIAPMRARIAERLMQSGPTVSQTVARMERDGLLWLDDERAIHLTDEGLTRAQDVMRKHRLAERILVDVFGLELGSVHEEACRWEHVISDEVERRSVALLADTTVSPYGNPIPGIERLSDLEQEPDPHPERRFLQGVTRLEEVIQIGAKPQRVRVRRLAETIQADRETLEELARMGALPGADVVVERRHDGYILRANDASCIIEADLASAIFVDAE